MKNKLKKGWEKVFVRGFLPLADKILVFSPLFYFIVHLLFPFTYLLHMPGIASMILECMNSNYDAADVSSIQQAV
jgi:hypothetical protein